MVVSIEIFSPYVFSMFYIFLFYKYGPWFKVLGSGFEDQLAEVLVLQRTSTPYHRRSQGLRTPKAVGASSRMFLTLNREPGTLNLRMDTKYLTSFELYVYK